MPARSFSVVAAVVNNDDSAIKCLNDCPGSTDICRHILVTALGTEQRSVQRIQRNGRWVYLPRLALDRHDQCRVILDKIDAKRLVIERPGFLTLEPLLPIGFGPRVCAALTLEHAIDNRALHDILVPISKATADVHLEVIDPK